MTAFIHDDFLLTTDLARTLYHEFARDLPIIDYHCHLDPGDLAEDRQFENLTQLWVSGDPYKHRAMRIAGVPEAEITGPADDRTKFDRWAATVPQTLGNPLYEWTALELLRYFGISETLSVDTADTIWEAASTQLLDPTFSARGLLGRHEVKRVFTSDRLLDDLQSHRNLQDSPGGQPQISPSLRADDLIAFDFPDYVKWLAALGNKTETEVKTWDTFCTAVAMRLDTFAELGCRVADYGLSIIDFAPVTESETATLFAQVAGGAHLPPADSKKLRTGMLVHLGSEYARRGWVMLLHIGAHRTTSSRLRQLAGPNGGHACPASPLNMAGLCGLLDCIEKRAGQLPRTIVFPLNPVDYPAVATLTGSFAADGVRGLVQLGPSWWYNDHALGIETHLDVLSSYGLLAAFIGMTTDSRSLLSTVRHEYFRRVACSWVGRKARAGHLPDNTSELSSLVKAICYDNAAEIFLAEEDRPEAVPPEM